MYDDVLGHRLCALFHVALGNYEVLNYVVNDRANNIALWQHVPIRWLILSRPIAVVLYACLNFYRITELLLHHLTNIMFFVFSWVWQDVCYHCLSRILL